MNYYEILNLKKDASQNEIKTSYKHLVKKYHPDVYKGDKSFAEFKTKEINIAYDVLSNPELKKEYDLSLEPKIEIEPQDSYNYNPYNSNKYNYYAYENYKRKYNNYTHNNYEKKHANYRASSSNDYVHNESKYYNRFSESIMKRVEKLTWISKLILILIFILVYILFFLINILQLQKLSNPNINYDNSNTLIFEDKTFDNYFNETDLQEYYYNYYENDNTFKNYEEFKGFVETYLYTYYTDK